MPFFSDTGPGGFQPKRQFRFLVTFSELSDLTFMVSKAAKPGYKLGSQEHKVLNHTFNFPGVLTCNDVQMTLIDAVDPNVGSKFYNALLNAGYVAPINEAALTTGITKVGSVSTLGEVRLKQLDGGGRILPAGSDPGEVAGAIDSTNVVEEWTLKNAFVLDVDFGALDYAQEGLVEIKVTLKYDYATYSNTPFALAT